MILNIIIFVVVFSILVLVHELGHFWAARRSKIKVEEFGLGLPPKLKTLWKDKHGTEYTLNAIPFGGFVRMLGQDDFDPKAGEKAAHDQASFENKTIGQKIFVITAGVIMNIILAWVLLTIAFMVGFRPLYVVPDGKIGVNSYLLPTQSFAEEQGMLRLRSDVTEHPGIKVVDVVKEGQAAQAGIQGGDYIVSINAQPLQASEDLNKFNQTHVGQELSYLLARGSTSLTVKITPVKDEMLGLILESNYELTDVHFSWYEAPVRAAEEVAKQSYVTVVLAGGVIHNLVAKLTVPKEVAGPVGIFEMTSAFSNAGLIPLLLFMAMLSISLAVINILPFPALDGGRFFFLLAELITRRKLPAKVEGYIHTAGFVLLMLLIIVITKNDLFRLFGWN